jgi:flagellar motility protein MotE (MotC chaperone)
MSAADGSMPKYSTDAKVLLSFEDKCYKHSNKLNEQIVKFYEIRKSMQVGRRADCFLWYSTASIPAKKHKRKDFEYEQLEDGRFCVTGWIGAPDVSDEELLIFVREIMSQQECLMTLKKNIPIENETIQSLATTGEHIIRLAESQINQVERITRSIKDLEQQRDAIRCAALEVLLRQYSTLQDSELLSKNDTSLNDSLKSLSNSKRTETDKLIKNKDEFVHLQESIQGSSFGKRRRTR